LVRQQASTARLKMSKTAEECKKEPICTIHQRLSKYGLPHVAGSEVRLPSGEVIPYVTSVNVRAVAGETWWEATLTVMARFGEPITGSDPSD
jgi:hypothetical protein